MLVELAGLGRCEQTLIQNMRLLHAAHGPREYVAAVLDAALPPPFGLFGQQIEPPYDVVCEARSRFLAQNRDRFQTSGQRGLLHAGPVVA